MVVPPNEQTSAEKIVASGRWVRRGHRIVVLDDTIAAPAMRPPEGDVRRAGDAYDDFEQAFESGADSCRPGEGPPAALPDPEGKGLHPLVYRGVTPLRSRNPTVGDAQQLLNRFLQLLKTGAVRCKPGVDLARIDALRRSLSRDPIPVDCQFGSDTEKATLMFQRCVFPHEPAVWGGKIGPNTWIELEKLRVTGAPACSNTTLDPAEPVICGQALPCFDLQRIRNWILRTRDALNQNNPMRTDFYLRYWLCHREIAWAFLAHMVSRNAGYQMSDLARLRALVSISTPALNAIFAFLEAGNFLIFRDVFPQLAAYQWSKRLVDQTGQDHSTAIFSMLADPAFGVDPLVINQWIGFFAAARAAAPRWWAGIASIGAVPEIVRHSVTLVANEQNHIEDRIINPVPAASTYASHFPTPLTQVIGALTSQGLTRLVFGADVGAGGANQLLLHTVGGFTSLDARIETGRLLYFGVFLMPMRLAAVERFARSRPAHTGSRTDYDALNYDLDSASLFPGGKKFSPPLISVGGFAPAWPVFPRLSATFGFVHRPPSGVPNWSSVRGSRMTFWGRPMITDGFAPPNGTIAPVISGRSLPEVVLEIPAYEGASNAELRRGASRPHYF